DEPGLAESADRFLNRELSWLDFNERVLALAEDQSLPLLERLKFAAIYANNLDEFFQVRVATLRRQQIAAPGIRSPDGLDATTQLQLVAERTAVLAKRHSQVFTRDLKPRMARAGVRVLRWHQVSDEAQAELTTHFTERVYPVLTPLAVDPGHPFPYISNLSLNLAVWLRDPGDRRPKFARIKVPPLLPRFVAADDNATFVALEEVIAANLELLFPGMEILSRYPFRLTRASDLELDDDDAEDLLRALEAELRRQRFSPAVRLEVDRRMPNHLVDLLVRELQLPDAFVHRLGGPLGLVDTWSFVELDRPDLRYRPFHPVLPRGLVREPDGEVDVFATLDRGDVLVHHPYDSFTGTVEAFIEQAAADPDVLAIKQTLYRTSGESPVVDALIAAAEAGKQVVVLVEIKARFDEQANIAWARMLERAGCHVVYGLVGLKTHCKLALVVRQEADGIRRYVHVGTGNYHPMTARLYEDLGLLTADPVLAADVGHLFNLLTGYSHRSAYDSMIVAPQDLRPRIIAMIRRQAEEALAGRPARITWKLNSLVDEEVIDALYEASQAGVRIDLVVRSICSLRPGVKALSDRVTVRSILGRFLEHSRIYRFGDGTADEIWIGSSDMMHRNLDRRVETLVRVDDEAHRARLRSILDLAVADRTAWRLGPDARWSRGNGSKRGGPPLQETLMLRAGRSADR
ncbi:MAG TPA: RNA degradosome polyphosphate kinase, partial [Candidatus Limnocylindria bacterium]|nr:RNA degradosome polyphosphate kinase [Candidatus Limnocylindria bacterium]